MIKKWNLHVGAIEYIFDGSALVPIHFSLRPLSLSIFLTFFLFHSCALAVEFLLSFLPSFLLLISLFHSLSFSLSHPHTHTLSLSLPTGQVH